MASEKHSEKVLELAKRGAQAQLNDLLHEIKLLVGLFPHLRDSLNRDDLPIPFLLKKGARRAAAAADALTDPAGKAAKRKRNLSPAARRAISNAQKRRWAAFNAAKKEAKKDR